MCSAPAVRTVVRAATAVMTMGTSEVARAIPGPVGDVARTGLGTIESVPVAAGTLAGMKNTPGYLDPFSGIDRTISKANQVGGVVNVDSPQSDETAGPGMPSPGATSIEGLIARRKRRLSALQAGLTSTIATSPTGLGGTPILSAPTAGGSNLKLKLGA